MPDAIAELLEEANAGVTGDTSESREAADSTETIENTGKTEESAESEAAENPADFDAAAEMYFKMPRKAGASAEPQPGTATEASNAAAIEEKAEEYLSAEDYETLNDSVGAEAAGIIKKLVDVIASKDKDIKDLKGFRGSIEKLGTQLAPLSDMAAKESRRQVNEAHEAFDAIAKHGGAEFFGANKADRAKNSEKYAEQIKTLWADATAFQNWAASNGHEKSIGYCLKAAWNGWAGKPVIQIADAKNDKKASPEAAKKAAMVKAAQEQGRRMPPIRQQQARTPVVNGTSSGTRQKGIPSEDQAILDRFLG